MTAQRLLSPDALQVDAVAAFLLELNEAQNSIFCFEDRYTSSQRFVGADPSADRLRLQAVGLGIMAMAPTIPCVFMGTEFFTAQNFTDNPEGLDWSFLSEREWGSMGRVSCSDRHGLYLLTCALMELRDEFPLHQMQFVVHWVDAERGLLTFSVEQGHSVLFAIVNLSTVSVEE